MNREEFKRLVTEDQPEVPAYFVHDAIRNRQERPSLDRSLEKSLQALAVEDVLRLRNQGVQLLDVRDAADFEGAHLASSVNIALKGKYATWCGTVLNHDTPIVIIAEPGTEEEAIVRLGRIGFDTVAGYLKGGMEALRQFPELIKTIDRITAVALFDQLASRERPIVLDVRSEAEWIGGHIDGSQNVPLNHLRERLGEIPDDRPIVVHCEGGYRSAIAASILAQVERKNIFDLVGGFKAWTASKLPVETAAVGA
jgi:rhodanese-related sulfurtransferase